VRVSGGRPSEQMVALHSSNHTHLITRLCVQQYPANLDDLCRILGHVDAMLIARCSYMDDDVAVEVCVGGLRVRCHDGGKFSGRARSGGRRGSDGRKSMVAGPAIMYNEILYRAQEQGRKDPGRTRRQNEGRFEESEGARARLRNFLTAGSQSSQLELLWSYLSWLGEAGRRWEGQ
jgi:hypothetical protein